MPLFDFTRATRSFELEGCLIVCVNTCQSPTRLSDLRECCVLSRTVCVFGGGLGWIKRAESWSHFSFPAERFYGNGNFPTLLANQPVLKTWRGCELFFYMQYYRSHDCWVPSMFGRVTKLFLVGKMLEAGYEALAKNILAPLASTGIFEKVCFSL